MKYIITSVIVLLSFNCFGQFVCTDEDSVRSTTSSLITATTARINGSTSHFSSGAPVSLQLKYVRVGFTDTITISTAPTTALRNLTGLQQATQYVYYYKTICGVGSCSQIGRYYFTTLSAAVVYTTERSTVFPYTKHDSGFVVPRIDTLLYRQPSTTGGNIVFRPGDSVFYGWNKLRWIPLMNSTAGISNKVDSVTVSGDSLFYWVNGTGYGYILPTANIFDATVDFSVNANPNTVGTTFSPNTPALTTKIYVSTIDGSQWTYNANTLTYVIYAPIGWGIFGNAGTTPGPNFIGNTDPAGLMFKVDNIQAGYIDEVLDNTSFGKWSLNNSTQVNNIAFGNSSLRFTTTGVGNTAFGYNTLLNNTTGSYNIGVGNVAGRYQTTQDKRLYINSIDRTNILGDTTKSIIYGAQDATAANQRLYANAKLYTPYSTNSASTNRVLGMVSGTGENTYLTLGSGISLSSGVLSATGSGGTVTGTGTNGFATVWTGTSSIGASATSTTQLAYLSGATGTTGTNTTNLVYSTSPTLITPALGTPTALVGTNITGTATAFNINGTVGSTTPASGAFTELVSPTITGGSSTTQTLTYKTTTGVGATGARHIFQVGNNGATEAMTILNNGNVGIGLVSPGEKLDVTGNFKVTGEYFQMVGPGGNNFLYGIAASANAWITGNASSDAFMRMNNTGKLNIGTSSSIKFGFNTTDSSFFSKGNVGIGTTSPTAVLHLKAGTATASTAPLKFTSGTNNTVIENGAVEYNGTRLFVSSNSTRQNIHQGLSGSFSGVGTATTVFTVTFGGTQPNATYQVNITPTAALSAALFYVTNKTTTTFDVTYLAGLTGTVTFDWTLVQ